MIRHIQHDIAEFWGYLMDKFADDILGIFDGTWLVIEKIRGFEEEVGIIQSRNSLRQAVLLPLPTQSATYGLQDVLDHWNKGGCDNDIVHAFLRPEPLYLFVQLACFTWRREQGRSAKCPTSLASGWLNSVVHVPCCTDINLLQHDAVPYQIHVVLLHHGDRPESGHFTALLRVEKGWCHRDDERTQTYTSNRVPDMLLKDVYCLILVRIHRGHLPSTGSSTTLTRRS